MGLKLEGESEQGTAAAAKTKMASLAVRREQEHEQVRTVLRAYCAPITLEEAFHYFDNLKMQDKISMDALTAYHIDFDERVDELTAAKCMVIQDPTFVLQAYIKGIRNEVLRNTILYAGVTTLQQAKDTLWQRIPALAAIAVVGAVGHRESNPARPAGDKKPFARGKGGQANNYKSPNSATAAAHHQGKGPICQNHPNGSHTWEECRQNPKNKTAGGAADQSAAARPAQPQQQQARPQSFQQQGRGGGGGKQVNVASMGSEIDATTTPPITANGADARVASAAHTHNTTTTTTTCTNCILSSPHKTVIPRYLAVAIKTPNPQQHRLEGHMGLVDTGADINIINPTLAHKLIALGCKQVPPPIHHICVLDNREIKVDTAVELDIELSVEGQQAFHTTATFIVIDRKDELLLGHPLLNLFAQERRLVATATVPEPLAAVSAHNHQQKSETKRKGPTIVPQALEEDFQKLQALVDECSKLFREPTPADVIKVDPVSIKLVREVKPLPMRYVPRAYQEVSRKVTRNWLKQGVVRPSKSPYNNPLVFVSKEIDPKMHEITEDNTRMCMDLRAVNPALEDDEFPMPHLKDTLLKIVGHKRYCVLDVVSAFLQVRVTDETAKLFAFTTADGRYEMLRLPFGCKNSSAIFQRIMNEILAEYLNVTCVCYVDDICVFADSIDELVERTRQVIQALDEHNVLLKASKCIFGAEAIEYLGHVVSRHGLTMAPSRISAFTKLEPPRDRKQLYSFLGMAGWYRDFIPNFSLKTRPLTLLTKKDNVFHWGEEQASAFENIKEEIIKNATLFTFNPEWKTILRTDASNYGIAGVLLQVDPDTSEEKVIGYYSKTLTDVEQRWSTVELEAYASLMSIKHFQSYLLGHHFLLETDSKNNSYIETCNNGKVWRWRIYLQQFHYDVHHIKGSTNVIADYLSRATSTDTAHLKKIQDVHNDIVGHMGINATIKRLEDMGSAWTTMRRDVVDFVHSCPTCVKTRTHTTPPPQELRTIEVWAPFEAVSLDFIGPMPCDGDNNKYILIAVDGFTRVVELFPTKDATAFAAANGLLHIFSRYGMPLEVRSDRGPHFTAEVIRQFLSLVDVKQRFSLAYHPQANGQVERHVQEVNRHLRALVFDQQIRDNWSSVLPLVARIMNSTPSSATGLAPATLLYGDRVQLDRSLFKPPTDSVIQEQPIHEYLQQLYDAQLALDVAARQYQADVLDKRIKHTPEAPHTYVIGETVMLKPPHGVPRTKLSVRNLGPYKVDAKTGTNSYILRQVNARDTDPKIEVHHERLIPYRLPRDADVDKITSVDHDPSGEFLVEAIIAHEPRPDIKEPSKAKDFLYHVKWVNYDMPTIEPASGLRNNVFFQEYIAKHKLGAATKPPRSRALRRGGNVA
jgi:hypothetical protein